MKAKRRSSPYRRVDKSQPNSDVINHLEGVEEQWRHLGGVWAGQIANARSQMETAIVELTRHFAHIATDLDALASTCRLLENDERLLAQAIVDSSKDENQPLVDELETTAARIEREAGHIRKSVEAAIVHLQFQDRVNQVLGHVEENINALPDAFASIRDTYRRTGELTPPDFTPLLKAIEASYTTAEEHALHRGDSVTEHDENGEITFF